VISAEPSFIGEADRRRPQPQLTTVNNDIIYSQICATIAQVQAALS
jgi:hypothetical protein